MLTEREAGAAEGERGLDVTGVDVAAYCDARLPQMPGHLDTWRARLNRDLAKTIGDRD